MGWWSILNLWSRLAYLHQGVTTDNLRISDIMSSCLTISSWIACKRKATGGTTIRGSALPTWTRLRVLVSVSQISWIKTFQRALERNRLWEKNRLFEKLYDSQKRWCWRYFWNTMNTVSKSSGIWPDTSVSSMTPWIEQACPLWDKVSCWILTQSTYPFVTSSNPVAGGWRSVQVGQARLTR